MRYLQYKIEVDRIIFNINKIKKTAKNDGLLYVNDPPYLSIEPSESSDLRETRLGGWRAARLRTPAGRRLCSR